MDASPSQKSMVFLGFKRLKANLLKLVAPINVLMRITTSYSRNDNQFKQLSPPLVLLWTGLSRCHNRILQLFRTYIMVSISDAFSNANLSKMGAGLRLGKR